MIVIPAIDLYKGEVVRLRVEAAIVGRALYEGSLTLDEALGSVAK